MSSSDFWSGSPDADGSNYAWFVYFGYGDAYDYSYRSNNYAVRLVRAGQSFGLLNVARPTADYIDHGDGTVTHSPTSLMWQRCAVGTSWTGAGCTGVEGEFTWDQAKLLTSNFAGKSDWRLPSAEELLSLVDYTKYDPSINTTLFSNTPFSSFWSGSPYARNSNYAWFVNFNYGYANYSYRSDFLAVRLVRGGQPLAPLTAPVCKLVVNPVVTSVGKSSVLTANCTPAATAYTWTNTGFAATASGGTVAPTTPTVYSVVGSNAAGSSSPASAAVYVCNTPPAQNYTGLTLVGSATNETITSGIASDTIDGGPGFDTVIYNCNRDSFTLTKTTSGWTVTSKAEGIDTLANVERIKFGDRTLALDITGNAGQAYRIYQAAFDRVPDNGGLKYWIGRMDAGTTLLEVAAGFVYSAEFQALYGVNPTNAEFLTKLYRNVLHRDPEQAGFDWWLGELNAGRYNKITALAGFSESPENQAGVLNAIINGIDLLN
jgi:hypothetical protein